MSAPATSQLNIEARVYDIDLNPAPCMWFALCENPANGLRKGPVGNGEFKDVPICQRCDDKAERLK